MILIIGHGVSALYLDRAKVTRYVVVDPNVAMHEHIRRTAVRVGLTEGDGSLIVLGCGIEDVAAVRAALGQRDLAQTCVAQTQLSTSSPCAPSQILATPSAHRCATCSNLEVCCSSTSMCSALGRTSLGGSGSGRRCGGCRSMAAVWTSPRICWLRKRVTRKVATEKAFGRFRRRGGKMVSRRMRWSDIESGALENLHVCETLLLVVDRVHVESLSV